MGNQNCIFLLPEAERMPLVQRLRLRYDPLAELIPPHITVVFPFEAALKPGTFRTLLEEQRAFLPIAFELGPPEVKDDCLFFPLGEGREAVMALTRRLYAALPSGVGLAASHVPHVTFGRSQPGQEVVGMLRDALQALPLRGMCHRLILESIGEDGLSVPELHIGHSYLPAPVPKGASHQT